MTKLFDYTEVKSQMIAERYRAEQNSTRLAGIAACKEKNLVVECFAGAGGLTNVYKQHFKEVLNNDINEESVAIHNMKAIDFVRTVLANLNKKIDMVDFDCYGSPAFEIQEFFKFAKKHAPFVLALSDGFGLKLKFSKREDPIRKRYLIDGPLNTVKIWDRHADLIYNLLTKLAAQNNLSCTELCRTQTKNKNYVLAAYVFVEHCKVVDYRLHNSGKQQELEMSDPKIETEILAVVKVKEKKGEDRQSYLDRLMRAVTKLPDDVWEGLSTDAQNWTNGAVESVKAKTDIEDFEVAPVDEETVAEEQPEQEEVVEKPVKKRAASNGTRKVSACHTIKKFVVKKPGITVAELSEKLKDAGFKVSDVTIATLRSDLRDTLRVLNELKITNVEL